MKTHSQFLHEESVGTYVDLAPTQDAAERVYSIFENKVTDLIDPSQFHVTINFSRKEFDPGFTSRKINEVAEPKQIEILGESAVVLMLDFPYAENQHFKYRKVYGATHDYDSYQPHLTLSYSGTLIDPELSVVEMRALNKIQFEYERVSELDLNGEENNNV